MIETDKKIMVESKPIVEIDRNLSIRGITNIDVPYKVVCDLTKVPPEKHSIIIQTLMSI